MYLYYCNVCEYIIRTLGNSVDRKRLRTIFTDFIYTLLLYIILLYIDGPYFIIIALSRQG